MSERIRLLFLTDTYLGGFAGSERYLAKLCLGLDPDQFDVKVIQLADKDIPHADGTIAGKRGLSLEQVRIGAVYGKGGRMLRARIGSDVREGRYDILHSIHEKADLLSLTTSAKVIRVSGRRDIGFKKSPLLRLVFKALNRRVDRFVVPARAIADDLVQNEHARRDRIDVIPNGLSLERFRMSADSDDRKFRVRLGLDPNSPLIGCIANLNPIKRHDLLLKAFSQVASQRPGAQLVLIGQGSLEPRLREIALELGVAGVTHFLGRRDDVPDLLACIDILVSTSDSEGLSNALIEAAAAGVPAVATAVGGTPEIVEDGNTGILVEPGNVDSIANAILALIDNPELRSTMSQRAAEKASRCWSLDSMIQAHQTLYRNLMGATSTRKGYDA